MALVGFNIVLVGDNFPVERIKAEDFRFNNIPLRETFRIPVALNAEIPGISIQVLPNRLQASVTDVQRSELSTLVENLVNMVTPFLDLVGTRLVTAVGHNAQFGLGNRGDRTEIYDALLSIDAATSILGQSPQSADVHFYTQNADGSITRMAFLSQSELDSIAIDFNTNFDLESGTTDARTAVTLLESSLSTMQEIASRATAVLVDKGKNDENSS